MKVKRPIACIAMLFLVACSENNPSNTSETVGLPDGEGLTAEEIMAAREVSAAVIALYGKQGDEAGFGELMERMDALREAVVARKGIMLAGHSGSITMGGASMKATGIAPSVVTKLSSNADTLKTLIGRARVSVDKVDASKSAPGADNADSLRVRLYASLDGIETAIEGAIPLHGAEAMSALTEIEHRITASKTKLLDPAVTSPTIVVRTTHK